MKSSFLLSLIASAALTLGGHAELEDVSSQFFAAVQSGDPEQLTKVFMESPTRDQSIADFISALPLIESGSIQLAPTHKELVIGELGASLVRFHYGKSRRAEYELLICVKTANGWQVFPWGSDSDLEVLSKQRSPDEQIHLKLFKEWKVLMTQQLEEDAN
ncbi:hypothetical protein HNR46_000917 [Haloferula luteola]|uniref:DUF4878 domain-containing protein n=1 Tax=Haloferula luteola TaxID=595692 RepID=A0A840VA78_9BACT|nr:hypothetical protein [Haloferula luteola]MBB5350689.1 hypothetical protein [Haloferula luteola]